MWWSTLVLPQWSSLQLPPLSSRPWTWLTWLQSVVISAVDITFVFCLDVTALELSWHWALSATPDVTCPPAPMSPWSCVLWSRYPWKEQITTVLNDSGLWMTWVMNLNLMTYSRCRGSNLWQVQYSCKDALCWTMLLEKDYIYICVIHCCQNQK